MSQVGQQQDLCVKTVEIPKNYNILNYPNGGYLAYLASQLMSEDAQHPDLLSLSANFLGHPNNGEAQVEIASLDVKKSISRKHLTLSQDNEAKAFYVATFTDFGRSKGLTHRFAQKNAEIKPIQECKSIKKYPFYPPLSDFLSNFDMHLAPGSLENPGPSQQAEIAGWISHADGSTADLPSLALFADAFLPPIFNLLSPTKWGSVPTIDYSVHLKRKPAPGPVFCRFWSDQVVQGMIEIDGELYDSEGSLVAVSRQLAKFRGEINGLSK